MPDIKDVMHDLLISGLRDAHAMEGQAITLTSGQADRLEHYPALQARFRQHLEESRGQQKRLEQLLEKYDTSWSSFKDITMKAAANMSLVVHTMTNDEVIKDSLASFAFEHFEIAAYRALITIAQAYGDDEIVEHCKANLKEEEAMAAWLAEDLPKTVKRYIELAAQGTKASP